MAHQIDDAENQMRMIVDNLTVINPDFIQEPVKYWRAEPSIGSSRHKQNHETYDHVSCSLIDVQRKFSIRFDCWANGKINFGFGTFFAVPNWTESLVAELTAVVRKHL